jgi:UPF0755 protein
MNRKALMVASLAAVLLVIALVIADFYMFLKQPVLMAGKSAIYDIKPGASFRHIAKELERRNLLTRYGYWLVLARLQGKAKSIKAGEYRLQGPLTPQQLLDRLVTGKTHQFSLTIVEGWTFGQVMNALTCHPEIDQTVDKSDDVMALLGKPGQHPEGWFFPDTYHFPRGTTDLEFLRRSHETMKARLHALWAARDAGLPLKTAYEALILASIVEKETAAPEERPLIAAVLLSRLEKGMRLQTDPTIVYGLGDSYDGDIRYRDLRLDTPYNTYTRKGLPPTPIAMPSGAALEAVVHPAESDALYFVAKKDGSHHFSTTYEEHHKAVIEYQLGGDADRYESQAQ